jgi:hypothetical protein
MVPPSAAANRPFLPSRGVGGGRDLLDARHHVPDRRADTDDLGRGELLDPAAQAVDLDAQPPRLEQAPRHGQDAVRMERLLQHVGRAPLDGIDGVGDGAMTGQDHDVGRQVAEAQRPDLADAVLAGQPLVQEHQVESPHFTPAHRLLRGSGGLHQHRVPGQQTLHALADAFVVVHHQDPWKAAGRSDWVLHDVRLVVTSKWPLTMGLSDHEASELQPVVENRDVASAASRQSTGRGSRCCPGPQRGCRASRQRDRADPDIP